MMYRLFGRRRARRGLWPLLSRVFYLNPQKQYMLIIVSAIAMATLVFTGILLFRQSDQGDLMTRGKWLMKQGKAALAVKEFEQMVRAHGGSYVGHIELGKAYMEINEPAKASKEFRIAAQLGSRNLKDSSPHIALARMMIAKQQYEDAERQLFQAYKARQVNRKNPELLLAMVDLYEDWGDSYLEANPANYEEAFLKYSAGLRFVKTKAQQAPLQEKLVSASARLSDIYSAEKEYDKAIAVLKRALHYDYNADNLVAIAAMYEQKEDLDEAIVWYRKAYQADPKVVSLKLSSMLMRKGRELNEAHQPKVAEKYFAEAKRINDTVKLPLDTLYPVEAANITLDYKVNPSTFDFVPMVRFDLKNAGNYPLNFLMVKVEFRTGEIKLADAQQIVATANDYLAPSGEPRGSKVIKVRSSGTIPLEDLEKGKLQVKVLVAYTNEVDAKWFEVKNVEKDVPEAQHVEDVSER